MEPTKENKRKHKEALIRSEYLMDKEEKGEATEQEKEEIEILIKYIETWENKYYPM